MPRSAIESEVADIVAPANELPAKIIAYLNKTPLLSLSAEVMESKSRGALEKAILLLRAHTGHDFSLYKRNTLYRRIERRMGLHQIVKMPTYVRYLQENPQELDLLFKELLIGVTSFFRDASTWEHLTAQALPELLSSRPPGQSLRAWVPGCSTGEEAYSLAMLLKEVADSRRPERPFAIQVFATDLDRDAIDKARQGFFPENIAADVTPERLQRFFSKEEHGYRVRKEIREIVTFAPQNLILDPPFTKLDIVSCRNLLIYLTPEVQKKLIPLFHYSLKPGGILLLGCAETISGFADLFTPISGKARMFRRKESPLRNEPVEFPSSFSAGPSVGVEKQSAPTSPTSLQALGDQLILQRYSPPAVLANDKGDILYISGRTGKYLEPAAGKANWNIFAMAREGLRYELADAFQKALKQKECVALHGLKVEANGDWHLVDLNVQHLHESGPLQGMVMIVFTDVPMHPKTSDQSRKPPAINTKFDDLEQELLKIRREARANREDMQTSQEELRSTNEELQSTNEELQSANVELTTSKEEMQSMNEELQMLNTELQTKLDELSEAKLRDRQSVLESHVAKQDVQLEKNKRRP